MVWLPWLRPLNCPTVRVPVTPSLAELNVASSDDHTAEPQSPYAAAIRHSAAATLVFASVSLAFSVSNDVVRRDLPAVPTRRSSDLSLVKLALAVAPQLPTTSRPWT